MENQEGYPKPKGQNKNVVGGTKTYTDYNILSNLPFTEHHYLPPGQRPPPPEEKPRKNVKVTTTGLRDYNIVTNRYLELHEEKIHVDKDIERLNAAKKYWKTHDYDPLNVEYYDPDKEQQFRETRKQEQKTHGQDWVQKLPKSWKEEGGLYNPVNGRIQDEKRLYERDLKEKNKRKRFELRYDMEHQARQRGLSQEERSNQVAVNRINLQRFKDTTDRGFDILTNKQFNNPSEEGSKTLYQPFVKPPPSTWTKVKNTSNAFHEIKSGSSNDTLSRAAPSENNEKASTARKLGEIPESGELNNKFFESANEDFARSKEVERRSRRLAKGSKTMSNFHKSTRSQPPIEVQKPVERAVHNSSQQHQVVPKVDPSYAKEITPAKLGKLDETNATSNVAADPKATNEAAFRKSINSSSRRSQKVGSTHSMASRTGRNIVAQTPKSKQSSMLSSNRQIRTGAFQRINNK